MAFTLLPLFPAMTVPAFAQTATIPLLENADGSGFSNMISVSVGGGATSQVLLDTGSTGLYIYQSQVGSGAVPLTPGGQQITFKYGYSSGNEVEGFYASATVSFPGASTTLATQPITVGVVTSLGCKASFASCPGWPTGQSGVMGVAYSAEPNAIFNPLAQLGGNYGNGFIIVSNDLADPNVSPSVIVGLNGANTAGFVWSSFQPDTAGGQPAGLNAWNTKSINTCFSVNNGSPGCYVTVFDTGANAGAFETGTSGDQLGLVAAGSSVNTTVPGVISFTTPAGSDPNENLYFYDPAHGTFAGYNSGAQVFRYYVVAYDAVNGRIGFAPLQNVLLGTIYASADADLGVVGGAVLLDGTLVMSSGLVSDRAIALGPAAALQVSGDVFLNGTLSGSVDTSVDMPSGSTLTLNGVSTYSGIMTVSGGSIAVNGFLPACLLLEGATLSGSGTVGGFAAANGSSVAPGNSIGTLGVLGNAVFGAGSTYEVEIGAAGTSDAIVAGGTVFAGGNVVVSPYGGAVPVLGSSYTIVTAAGGVSGTFASVSGPDFGAEDSLYPFLTPGLSYSANAVELEIGRSTVSFAAAAHTRNQLAAATLADAASPANEAIIALAGLNATTATPGLDALSGEIYASAATVMQQQSVYVRDAVGARVRQAFGDASSALATAPTGEGAASMLWVQGFGGWGQTSSDGNAAEVTNSIGGLMYGLDTALGENWRAGLLGGYSVSSFDVSDRASSGSMNNYDIGVYAGTQEGPFALYIGAAYTWHDVTTSRSVSFAGFSGANSSDYTTGTTQVFGEASYEFLVGGTHVDPFAGLAYVGVDGGSLREMGSASALWVNNAATDVFYSTLGLRAAAPIELLGRALQTSVTLGWQHAFGDVLPEAYIGLGEGGASATIAGVPIAEDAALLGLELAYAPTTQTKLAMKYSGQLASSASQNVVMAQWQIRF